MRMNTRKHTSRKAVAREKKRMRIRHRVAGDAERPRLAIFRSARHIYAQIIDDVKGHTLVSASTVEIEGTKGANKNSAKIVGQEIAKRALSKNLKSVVFDRGGYLYHGRVQALADGAREGGLQF